MTDYVIDASALVLALGGKSEAAEAIRARLPGMRRHAPHLIDAEVGNVLRRHEQAARLSSREAQTALRAAQALVDHRYPHAGGSPNEPGPCDTASVSTTRSTSPWPTDSAFRC